MAGGGAPAPGAELGGRYRLESLLGAGGMATVWRARDTKLGREVAVKALSDTLAHDSSYLDRFAREARVAASLSHPNVVRVLDYGAGEGTRPFLVLELLEGGTLAGLLRANDPVDSERLAGELLAALDHIHTHGIVHRDVKPANVLIGPDGAAKLTDFGIAQPEDATRYTATGMVVGTLDYMAPELTAGAPADARSDLYALGVVLSECDPPPTLEPLIDRLTQADPADRPASATAALELLPGRPAPTIPLDGPGAGGPREVEMTLSPRALLAAAAAVIAIAAGALLLTGGEEAGERAGGSDQGAERAGEGGSGEGGGADAGRDEDGGRQPAAETAPPAAPAAGPADCELLEIRHERVKERGKAAERAAGTKEEREAAKEAFKARAERAKERQKACEEATKERGGSGREEDDDDDDDDD